MGTKAAASPTPARTPPPSTTRTTATARSRRCLESDPTGVQHYDLGSRRSDRRLSLGRGARDLGLFDAGWRALRRVGVLASDAKPERREERIAGRHALLEMGPKPE
jgi:hypothetical protein